MQQRRKQRNQRPAASTLSTLPRRGSGGKRRSYRRTLLTTPLLAVTTASITAALHRQKRVRRIQTLGRDLQLLLQERRLWAFMVACLCPRVLPCLLTAAICCHI